MDYQELLESLDDYGDSHTIPHAAAQRIRQLESILTALKGYQEMALDHTESEDSILMITPNPCPFCKKEAPKVGGYHATLSAKSEIFVECLQCGARGPVVEFDHYKGQTEKDVYSAIHWWNNVKP